MNHQNEIESLREENKILRQAISEQNRINRMTYLYESAQEEIQRLSKMVGDWKETAEMLAIDLGNPDCAIEVYIDIKEGLYKTVRERQQKQDKQLWNRDVDKVVLLRQMLTHAIYCPRQACSYCSEIEKEVRHESE